MFYLKILDKRALQDLVKEVDPSEQLDEDVEDVIILILKFIQFTKEELLLFFISLYLS